MLRERFTLPPAPPISVTVVCEPQTASRATDRLEIYSEIDRRAVAPAHTPLAICSFGGAAGLTPWPLLAALRRCASMRQRFSSSLQALACLALLLAAAPARAQTFAGRKLAGCFGALPVSSSPFYCQRLSSAVGVREARTHEAVDGLSLLLCCSVRRQGRRQAVCESQPLLQQMGEGGAGHSPGQGMPAPAAALQ